MTKVVILCLVHALPSCLSLTLNYNSDPADVQASRKTDFGANQWGLIIDGKDAAAGPHAYGKDFEKALGSLDFVLHQTGDNDLTFELITDIHSRCCGKYNFRRTEFQPLKDLGCDCFKNMTVKDRDEAIRDIPKDLISFLGENGTCTLPRKMAPKNIRPKLFQILRQYNEDAKMIPREDKKQQISVLADFLRKFAWLHPFGDGNGRLRTLLLQRELRHRDVARGAFMYNNNRDIYFISKDMYVAKIEEGIKMASVALGTNSNPWVNRSHVAAHFKQFPKHACHSPHKRDSVWGSVDFDKAW